MARTLDDLRANLTDLAARYKQDIMVVEYSVPNMRQINDIVHGLPGGKGLGTFIWEPTKWEGPALFDAKGNTKPEIEVYPDGEGVRQGGTLSPAHRFMVWLLQHRFASGELTGKSLAAIIHVDRERPCHVPTA